MGRSDLRRSVLAAGVVLGAVIAVGSWTEASGNGSIVEELTASSSDADGGSLVDPIRGDPPSVFSDKVSAVDNATQTAIALDADGVTVRLQRSSSGEICWTATFDEVVAGGCDSLEVIRTGLAFGQFFNHGRGTDLVGVVPDDVAFVMVNDARVEVVNNVWYFGAGESRRHIALRISNADGSKVVAI